MHKATLLLVACVLAIGSAYAGKDVKNLKAAPLITNEPISTNRIPGSGQYVDGLDNATSLNWVVVDTMANAFGPASNQVTPLVFDPGTGALCMIHRGGTTYGAGASGSLWYNVSLDGGTTWRRVGEISANQVANLRYPGVSMKNAFGSADTAQVWVTYAAPNLRNAGTFGSITYGIDIFGQNVPFSAFDDGPAGAVDFTSNLSIWSGTGNDSTIFWATRRGTNEWYLWHTEDYATVDAGTPPTWANANFTNPFSYIGGTYLNGKSFFNVISIFVGDSANVENFGYSTSTDGGATWSAWTRPPGDWVVATGLTYFYDLLSFYRGTGNFASYEVEAQVDANARMHYFAVTVDSPWTLQSSRSLLEVYQTATGWDHKFITQSMNQNTGLMYPGPTGTDADVLDQTYNAIKPSISPDGQVMSLVWLDAATPAGQDTTPDIWFSWRRIDGANWSTPVNLTETPGFSELLLHAAPTLRDNGGNNYTMFLGRSYQTGINTYPPDNTTSTSLFAASYSFSAPTTSVSEGTKPVAFTLEQNYPNPFNPSTSIKYSIDRAGYVTLKVFNALGQEVATLVNGNVASGSHQVKFDASKLSSGLYFYKMTAGSNIETRKMLLLK